MNTPIGRDFKRTSRRNGVQLGLSREFFAGPGIGLGVAVAVFLWQSPALKDAEAADESLVSPETRSGAKSN